MVKNPWVRTLGGLQGLAAMINSQLQWLTVLGKDFARVSSTCCNFVKPLQWLKVHSKDFTRVASPLLQ